MDKASEKQAVELAAIVFGSYPRSDAPMPEVYLEQLKRLFVQYPHTIGETAAQKLTLTYKSMPSVANVAIFLEEEAAHIQRFERAERHRLLEAKRAEEDAPTNPKPTPAQIAKVEKTVAETVAALRSPEAKPEAPKPNHVPMTKQREEEAFRNLGHGKVPL